MPYLKLGPGPEHRVKVACAPCIRGHRATQCTHIDTLLIEVKRPGRPQVNHVSLPLNHHPCKDGEARVWRIPNRSQLSDRVKANARDHTFQADEIAAAGAQPYPKPSAKRGAARRKTLVTTPEDSSNEFNVDSNTVAIPRTPSKPSDGPRALSEHIAPKSCCSSSRPSPGKSDQSDHPSSHSIQRQKQHLSIQPKVDHASSKHDVQLNSSPQVTPERPLSMNPKPESSPLFTAGLDQSFHQATPVLRPQRSASYQSHASSTEASFMALQDIRPIAALQQPDPYSHAPLESFGPSTRCICGTACNCLGCPQHPHNPTTTAHINEVNQYMATDPVYNPERYLDERRSIKQRLLEMCQQEVSSLDEESDWEELSKLYARYTSLDRSAIDGHWLGNLSPMEQHSYSASFHNESSLLSSSLFSDLDPGFDVGSAWNSPGGGENSAASLPSFESSAWYLQASQPTPPSTADSGPPHSHLLDGAWSVYPHLQHHAPCWPKHDEVG